MSGVLLKQVSKTFPGGSRAVTNFTLNIKDGEFLTILAPSASGKSTILRMIAGFEEVADGEIYIDGKKMNAVPAKNRDVAMVFQNSKVYPHLTVYENLAFGLNARNIPQKVIEEKVKNVAEILALTDCLNKKSKNLTGKQRLRVILGRIMAREPKVYLFDEALASLDPKLRSEMRTELVKIHSRLNGTFVYATSDQTEAMVMGTRVAVMKNGFLQQVDTPQNLYDYPVNMFVANYIGSPRMNFFKNALITENEGKVYVTFANGNKILLPGIVVSRIKNISLYKDTGKPVVLGVRCEDVHQDELFISASPDTVIKARTSVIEQLGSEQLAYCDLDLNKAENVYSDCFQMVARIPGRAVIRKDEIIDFAIDAKHVQLFDGEDEFSILERDEHYDAIKGNEDGASYVPPTPKEMKSILNPESLGKGKRK